MSGNRRYPDDQLDNDTVNKFLPQISTPFVGALRESLNKLPLIDSHKRKKFVVYHDESRLLFHSRLELLHQKKGQKLKYGKMFDNPNVTIFAKEREVHVTCPPSDRPMMHEFNSGIVFYVPLNHILILHAQDSEKYACNPIVLDASTRTDVFFYINVPVSETETVVKFRMELCHADEAGARYKAEPIKKKAGRNIHNFKQAPQRFHFSRSETGLKSDPNTVRYNCSEDGKINVDLQPGTLFGVIIRKREHRNSMIPLCGVLVTKDKQCITSKFGDLPLPKEVSEDLSLLDLSFFIARKFLDTFDVVRVDRAPAISCNSNGGYNGWIYSYEPDTYEAKKTDFRDSQRVLKWLMEFEKIKKFFGITEPTENFLKVLCKGSIETLKKECSTLQIASPDDLRKWLGAQTILNNYLDRISNLEKGLRLILVGERNMTEYFLESDVEDVTGAEKDFDADDNETRDMDIETDMDENKTDKSKDDEKKGDESKTDKSKDDEKKDDENKTNKSKDDETKDDKIKDESKNGDNNPETQDESKIGEFVAETQDTMDLTCREVLHDSDNDANDDTDEEDDDNDDDDNDNDDNNDDDNDDDISGSRKRTITDDEYRTGPRTPPTPTPSPPPPPKKRRPSQDERKI